jgi:polyisoprenoid-binding protein YceI
MFRKCSARFGARGAIQEDGLMTAGTQAQALTTWKIDPAHSAVEFAVKHMMITTVKGRFADVSGTAELDVDDPAAGRADITIAAASIDTRDPQRDAHLRSADFFDVERYPTLTFRSTRIKGTAKQFTLTGDLTIHGVTRPVTLDVTFEGGGKDPWGGERVGYNATGKINRKDFGLTWNAALETGGLLVGDDVKITLDLELIKG